MRKRIIAVLCIAVIAGMSAVWAADAKPMKLTYANFPPPKTFPCVQMERWADEVEKQTGGKVAIQTFPGSTLLNPKNMVDGVKEGMADIGCLAMSYQPGRFPVSQAVDLPVGFTSSEAASMALYDLLEKYKPAEFKDVKILAVFTCPPCSLMTSTPVKTLDDLKGMELRSSGTGVGVLKALGGSPIAMPMSDTPDAIQRGVVKGIVSSLEVLKDFNFAAYCPYATKADLFVVTFAVVMNKDKYDALPADVKKVFDDMARPHSLWTGKYVDEHVDEALAWSAKERNHQVFQFSAADQKEIEKRMKPLIDEYKTKTNAAGLPADKIVEDLYALKAKYEKKAK